MLALSFLRGLPLTVGRRVLTALIGFAVALAPLGAAAATARGQAVVGMSVGHSASQHGASALQDGASKIIKAEAKSDDACCPCENDKSDCGQSCLQNCSVAPAVMPAEPVSGFFAVPRFAMLRGAQLPDWSPGPQLPPPRS